MMGNIGSHVAEYLGVAGTASELSKRLGVFDATLMDRRGFRNRRAAQTKQALRHAMKRATNNLTDTTPSSEARVTLR
jgi:hypothetical protein